MEQVLTRGWHYLGAEDSLGLGKKTDLTTPAAVCLTRSALPPVDGGCWKPHIEAGVARDHLYIHSPLLDHRQQHQNQTRFSPIKTSTVSTAEDLPSLPFLETRLELAHTVNIASWLCCSTQLGLPKSPPFFRRMPRFSVAHAAVRPQGSEGARWQSRSLPSW